MEQGRHKLYRLSRVHCCSTSDSQPSQDRSTPGSYIPVSSIHLVVIQSGWCVIGKLPLRWPLLAYTYFLVDQNGVPSRNCFGSFWPDGELTVQRQRLNRLISLSQNPVLFSCSDDMITKSGQICIQCHAPIRLEHQSQ